MDTEEMYGLVAGKGATLTDFLTWLDTQPWVSVTTELDASLESLLIDGASSKAAKGSDEADIWTKWEEEAVRDGVQGALQTLLFSEEERPPGPLDKPA
ncbi:hypothetical protein FRC10_010698, partial [Ceratobasidium sp. 414]